MPVTPEQVRESLRQVIDPEVGLNLVDLGLIYDIRIHENHVDVDMTVTNPNCPMHEVLISGVRNAVCRLPSVSECQVRLVFEPPWTPAMISEHGRKRLESGFSEYILP